VNGCQHLTWPSKIVVDFYVFALWGSPAPFSLESFLLLFPTSGECACPFSPAQREGVMRYQPTFFLHHPYSRSHFSFGVILTPLSCNGSQEHVKPFLEGQSLGLNPPIPHPPLLMVFPLSSWPPLRVFFLFCLKAPAEGRASGKPLDFSFPS